MPKPLALLNQKNQAPDGRVSGLTAWLDPRNPFTTAAELITRYGQRAEDHATTEMACAQAVGDGDTYDSWWAIRDAIAELQGPPN
jgi:hypothetical protein